MTPTPGRPRKPAEERVQREQVMMTQAQADHIRNRAKLLNISFSHYIRLLMDRDIRARSEDLQ